MRHTILHHLRKHHREELINIPSKMSPISLESSVLRTCLPEVFSHLLGNMYNHRSALISAKQNLQNQCKTSSQDPYLLCLSWRNFSAWSQPYHRSQDHCPMYKQGLDHPSKHRLQNQPIHREIFLTNMPKTLQENLANRSPNLTLSKT